MAKVLVAVEDVECEDCPFNRDCPSRVPHCPIHGEHRDDALRDALQDFIRHANGYCSEGWGSEIDSYITDLRAGTWPPKE